jgi:hypothetical protein
MESLFASIASKLECDSVAAFRFSSLGGLEWTLGSRLADELLRVVSAHPRERFARGEGLEIQLPKHQKSSSLLLALPLFALNAPELAGVMVAVTRPCETEQTPEATQTLRYTLQGFAEVVLSLERYLAQCASAVSTNLDLGAIADAEAIGRKVADIYDCGYRKRSGARDQWEQVGRELFVEKVALLVRRRLPISFVLPAFPCKSRNRERKVSGTAPDKGELLSLARLAQLVRDVESNTGYPAKMIVVSDGRVFADLVKVSDDLVSEYSRRIRELGSRFKELSFFGLEDAFAVSSHDQARERLMAMYGASEAWINDRLR